MGFEKILRRLLEYGVLAPSIYNSQPWKFSIDSKRGIIGVYADKERVAAKPKRGDLYLSLGACVEYIVLAGPALGYEIQETLFPRGDQEGPAALLLIKPLAEAMPETLFGTLLTRQTNAGKYLERSVKEIHLDRLKAMPPFSSSEKIYLVTEDAGRQTLIQLLHDLSHEGSGFEWLVEEEERWIRPSTNPLDGLPLDHLGLPLSTGIRFACLKPFFYAKEIREVARQALLRQGHRIEAPAFLLMTTQNPTSRGYFNAGRWYARLALTLTDMEIACQSLHLPIAMADKRGQLNALFQAAGFEEPVLLMRFGQPEKKIWPKTSRRPIDQYFLENGEVKKFGKYAQSKDFR